MYLRAQGLRSSDAFRILQLAPIAPRELIVEVYWALVSRTRQGDPPNAQGRDLGAAYAVLMDEDRTDDPASPGAANAQSPYANLRVDAAADAGIIDAAYSFLSRNRQRMKRREWQAVDEAYRILANPKLRAQYDASRSALSSSSSAAPVFDRPPIPRSPAVARRQGLFGRAERAPELADGDRRLLGLRGAALASLPDPVDRPTPMPLLMADTVAEVVFVAGAQAGLRVPLGEPALTLGADSTAHVFLDGLDGHDGVRIWQHGDRFMLRKDGDGPILIEGLPLALPVMALDDGDEIALGGHRLRFRRILCA